MTKYKATGIFLVLCFVGAYYAAIQHGAEDVWIVAAFAALVIWATVGIATALTPVE